MPVLGGLDDAPEGLEELVLEPCPAKKTFTQASNSTMGMAPGSLSPSGGTAEEGECDAVWVLKLRMAPKSVWMTRSARRHER